MSSIFMIYELVGKEARRLEYDDGEMGGQSVAFKTREEADAFVKLNENEHDLLIIEIPNASQFRVQ